MSNRYSDKETKRNVVTWEDFTQSPVLAYTFIKCNSCDLHCFHSIYWFKCHFKHHCPLWEGNIAALRAKRYPSWPRRGVRLQLWPSQAPLMPSGSARKSEIRFYPLLFPPLHEIESAFSFAGKTAWLNFCEQNNSGALFIWIWAPDDEETECSLAVILRVLKFTYILIPSFQTGKNNELIHRGGKSIQIFLLK